jgi:hypothetical protein
VKGSDEKGWGVHWEYSYLKGADKRRILFPTKPAAEAHASEMNADLARRLALTETLEHIPPDAAASRDPRVRAVAEVVETADGRKVGLWGKAQGNTSPLHDEGVMQLMRDLAATGDFAYVTTNKGWEFATGQGSSALRPDVLAVARDARGGLRRIVAYEMESVTDPPTLLARRLTDGASTFRGTPVEVEYGVYRPAYAGEAPPAKHPNAIRQETGIFHGDLDNPPVTIYYVRR